MRIEKHLQTRPRKKIFAKSTVKRLRDRAIGKLKKRLLPDEKILKILMIGSSVKYSFGRYSPPGFRGSLYSDFDFIVFVKANYNIPSWLNKELSAKPFPDDSLNLAYREKKFIDNKYDVELFFVRERSMKDKKIQKLGEMVGIPMTKTSKNKYLVVYEK